MRASFLIVFFLSTFFALSFGQGIQLDIETKLPVSEKFYFGHVSDASVLPNGSIIVLDSQKNQLLKFNSSGILQDTVAREGKGPGELSGPLDLATGPSGKIAVFDIKNVRITFWDAKGNYIQDYAENGGWGASLDWNNKGELVFRRHPFQPDENGNRVISFTGVDTNNGEKTKEGVIPLTSQFDSQYTCVFCRWTLTNESTIITALNDTKYEFYELTIDGKKVRSWRRKGMEPVRYSERELEQIKQKRKESPIQVSKDKPLPTYKDWFKSFEIDSKNRIWVQVATKDGQSAFDIFDMSGAFLQRITIDREILMLELKRGLVLARTDEPTQPSQVLIYRFYDYN
ncbi:6-bladed beta-propeller [Fodinibius halophilus]|uniref:6-bladed beta-propeller n=1 Tax=Fodinibius halophilus TaxID=1736908 RepID=A0A6M1T3V3_9BACT|nr:6-bladed beta-propeller [Fodinibius halophilus]NGP90096.1 hypothetical protein [Fodinibius halophilus]